MEKTESVSLIATGYEWVCPGCGKFNCEIEWRQKVTCAECEREYEAQLPEHAWG